MKSITDEYMRKMLQAANRYTLVILRRTGKRGEPGADEIVWEHGRRNFELRRDGLLCIVGPVIADESEVAGVCIFTTDLEQTRRIMNEDPAVKAGIFVYDAHAIESFPGDALTDRSNLAQIS